MLKIGAKKKVELTITGIGIIIFMFLIANHLSRPINSKVVPKIEPYVTLESTMTVISKTTSGNDVEWGRDPFLLSASNVKPDGGMEGLDLNGIMSDKANPYAIINNDVVKLGDKVNGMVVIEINEKNVVLEQNGQKHTLELNVY